MFPILQAFERLVLVAGRLAPVTLPIILAVSHAVHILLNQILAHGNKTLDKENLALPGSHLLSDILTDHCCFIIIQCKGAHCLQAVRLHGTFHAVHLCSKGASTRRIYNNAATNRSRQLYRRHQICIYNQLLCLQPPLHILFDLLHFCGVTSTVCNRIFRHTAAHRAGKQDTIIYQLLCNATAFSLRPVGASKSKIHILLIGAKNVNICHAQRNSLQQQHRLKDAALIRGQTVTLHKIVTVQNHTNIRAQAAFAFSKKKVPQQVNGQQVFIISRAVSGNKPLKALCIRHVRRNNKIEHAALVGTKCHRHML